MMVYAIYTTQGDALGAWDCMNLYHFIYLKKENIVANGIDPIVWLQCEFALFGLNLGFKKPFEAKLTWGI